MKNSVVAKCDERPAGQVGECFYCKQAIGHLHTPKCVIPQRRAKIRVAIEYEVDVPACFSVDDIEFQRNEGSWCANNLLDELNDWAEKSASCLCRASEFSFIKYVDEELSDTPVRGNMREGKQS